MRTLWVEDALSLHEGALVTYAARILGDAHRARDVVQETFLRLCRERPEQVGGHLRPWLFTVCRRIAFDELRKERRMTPEPGNARGTAGATAEAVLDGLPAAVPDPAAAAEVRDDASHALRAVAGLPAAQREVVDLRFRHGMSYAEIAEVTGHSVTNVGFILHTAMKSLRNELTKNRGA